MATLERRNHPNEHLLTGTITLKKISGNNLRERILTLATKFKRGREERVQQSAMIHNSCAFDLQRLADNTAHVKQ